MANTNLAEMATTTERGVEVNGMLMEPVIDKCNGCERIVSIQNEQYCSSYPQPSKKWRHGACNFATHIKASVDKAGEVKINPIKASKRAARKK
ncbi:MAG: PxxKW family cysteine-rich protein [Thermodesulfobacteriota bacterium]